MSGATILFDLDGTLVDSLPGIEFSIREAFSVCKLPLPKERLREMIGPPIRTILSRAGKIAEESSLDRLERAFRASYDSVGWRRTVCFPDADRILRMMHERRHRLFVVSNKPLRSCLQILKRVRIRGYFEAVVTRDSRSPNYQGKEEMVEVLLADHAITRENCLMVGDTTEDANAASSAGIKFIWMTHGYGTVVEMSSIPVAHTLDSFAQLLHLLNEGVFCD